MTRRLAGQTVAITGGGGSIGRVTALRMAREGARIAVLDWAAAAGERVAEEIRELGGSALALTLDVAQPRAVEHAFAQVAAALGPVDVLVNTAAISETDDVLETDWDGWRRDLDVSLGGVFLCSKAVLPGMIERGGGTIVNVTSVNAFTAIDNEAYSAAKAGIVALTRMMATRYGSHGVRVVGLAPGAVRTDHPAWLERLESNPRLFDELARWYPLGRIGEPEDVADATLFLASSEASWITGTTLVVDGGLLAGNPLMMREVLAVDTNPGGLR